MMQINRSAQQLLAPIVSNKKVGQYQQIIINIGDLASVCKPGNFVAINVGGSSSSMVLRRAFAISRVSISSTFGGTMELIVAPHGQGSKWLCAQGEGVVLRQKDSSGKQRPVSKLVPQKVSNAILNNPRFPKKGD